MSTTDYSGMFVYKDGHIDYVQTSEGRMKRAINGIYNAEYFIKDHLGNVRVVYSTISGPSQVTDYYPFGLEIAVSGTSYNQIKYNSKELQRDAKLDWYDYGARFYDPVLGRWHSVDPLAETSRRWSPYTYCLNNPIRFIDPDGMNVDWFENERTGAVYYNSSYTQGDESKIKGEGWKWMGANGMFEKNDATVLYSNIDLTDRGVKTTANYNSDALIPSVEATKVSSINMEATFSGENAQKFMGKMGYNLVPTQATLYTLESMVKLPFPNGGIISYTYGNQVQINEKYKYFSSNFQEISVNEISSPIYNPGLFFQSSERVSRVQIQYSNNVYLKGSKNIVDTYQALGGTHIDFLKKVYSGWSSYPSNNPLINQFRQRYGTN